MPSNFLDIEGNVIRQISFVFKENIYYQQGIVRKKLCETASLAKSHILLEQFTNNYVIKNVLLYQNQILLF